MAPTFKEYVEAHDKRHTYRRELIAEITSAGNLETITKIINQKANVAENGEIDLTVFHQLYPSYLDTILQHLRAYSIVKKNMVDPSKTKNEMEKIVKKLRGVEEIFQLNPAIASLLAQLEAPPRPSIEDSCNEEVMPASKESLNAFFNSQFPEEEKEPKVMNQIRELIRGLDFLINHEGNEWVGMMRFKGFPGEIEEIYSLAPNSKSKAAYVVSYHLIDLAERIKLKSEKGQGDFISECSKLISDAASKHIKNLGQIAVSKEEARTIVRTIRSHFKNLRGGK